MPHCDYVLLCFESIWSQCVHWWTTRSLNVWQPWRRTLRKTWGPDCSGTSNWNPGGPPTMWVLDCGFFLFIPQINQSVQVSQFSFSPNCTGEWLVGGIYLPQRSWPHHGKQQLLCDGKLCFLQHLFADKPSYLCFKVNYVNGSVWFRFFFFWLLNLLET